MQQQKDTITKNKNFEAHKIGAKVVKDSSDIEMKGMDLDMIMMEFEEDQQEIFDK